MNRSVLPHKDFIELIFINLNRAQLNTIKDCQEDQIRLQK